MAFLERTYGKQNPATINEVLISSDSHVIEPAGLWQKQLPKAFRDRAPDYGGQRPNDTPGGAQDKNKRVSEMAADGVSAEVLYPTHEDGCGRTELRGSHPLAAEVLRRSDPRIGADVNARVSKDLGERDRHGDKRAISAPFQAHVRAQRKLRNLELFVFQHSRESLARTQDLDLQMDAFRLDTAVDERASAVIIPARQGEFEFRHRATCLQRKPGKCD